MAWYLLKCPDDIEGARAVDGHRHVVAARGAAAVVRVGPAKPLGVQVEQEIFEVCDPVGGAQENAVRPGGGDDLPHLLAGCVERPRLRLGCGV